jgi:hypothetical protein
MMKRKSVIVPVLIIISLMVWGNNAYQIFIGLTRSNEDPDRTIESHLPKNLDDPNASSVHETVFTYRGDTRDPFQPGFWPSNPTSKNSIKRKPARQIVSAPASPNLRFCGVLTDSNGRLAIIEKADGESMLVREKETAFGVVVLSIQNDHLECRFEKQSYRLELTP